MLFRFQKSELKVRLGDSLQSLSLRVGPEHLLSY